MWIVTPLSSLFFTVGPRPYNLRTLLFSACFTGSGQSHTCSQKLHPFRPPHEPISLNLALLPTEPPLTTIRVHNHQPLTPAWVSPQVSSASPLTGAPASQEARAFRGGRGGRWEKGPGRGSSVKRLGGCTACSWQCSGNPQPLCQSHTQGTSTPSSLAGQPQTQLCYDKQTSTHFKCFSTKKMPRQTARQAARPEPVCKKQI